MCVCSLSIASESCLWLAHSNSILFFSLQVDWKRIEPVMSPAVSFSMLTLLDLNKLVLDTSLIVFVPLNDGNLYGQSLSPVQWIK